MSAEVDNAVAAVRSAYSQLVGSLGSGWFESDAQAQVRHSVEVLGPQIDDWATRRRRWAEAGQRDDGSPYSWSQWADQAQVLSDAISAQGSYYVDGSTLKALKDAVVATGGQLAADASSVGGFLGSRQVWIGGAILLGSFVAWKVLR